ncbi:transposable element Tc1 transposase [Trichonephila clavipes]|nr:transposable element Tc1 transposase [Trichonephila clavipes]
MTNLHIPVSSFRAGWKYTRIYNPQRRLRVLVIKCRTDPSQIDESNPNLAHNESLFNLWNHDSRIRVRCYAGKRCLSECVIERHSGLTPGVMVWGAISCHGRSNLLRNEGNLNNNRYVRVVLQLEVIPFFCQVIYSQFRLAIHQNDHQARRRFVEWAQHEIVVVPDFHKRILFSNEAHFWLNGYVNKQNCRIWSEANPQVYVETPLHPEKLTVWCALWAGGIIGPYFFKNDEGHNVTVNGDRYRAMITNFFIPELNNHDVQELWFQQDGATCHTARATIDLLKDTFGVRLISRFGPVNWPPRSCD